MEHLFIYVKSYGYINIATIKTIIKYDDVIIIDIGNNVMIQLSGNEKDEFLKVINRNTVAITTKSYHKNVAQKKNMR